MLRGKKERDAQEVHRTFNEVMVLILMHKARVVMVVSLDTGDIVWAIQAQRYIFILDSSGIFSASAS